MSVSLRRNPALSRAAFLFALVAFPAFSQYIPNRYALVLADPSVGERFASRESLSSAAAVTYRQQVEARQRTLITELRSRRFPVNGSVSTLLNAVFVTAPAARRGELGSLPGVLAVVPMRRMKRNVNAATQLVNAPAAWANANVGGRDNAGRGIRIAIIDTGIDQKHPAFQDSSLQLPSGYPICTAGHPEDCQFTNNKVIVARSYVRQLAAGDASGGADPETSRPDDYSPRDRVGHGTAVASVAAANVNTGAVTFTGMAPKAYLGNYKVYGSPGVNDYSSEDLFIQALNDALDDGMNVANLSGGDPSPTTGPLDTGAACGAPAGTPCDLLATAYEAAAKKGMVVVVAAGNSGAFNSISSPATAPSVIAVGATVNSHTFGPSVSISDDPSAPSSTQNIAAVSSDAFWPYYGATKAPLVDVSQFGDPAACQALDPDTLKGDIALVQVTPSSTCDYSRNVQAAGAIGLVAYLAAGATWPNNAVQNVDLFYGPVVGIPNSAGVALKNYLSSKSGKVVNATIDLAGIETQQNRYTNQLAGYSSLGPSLGDAAVKPDLVATGGYDSNLSQTNLVPAPSGMYMATQSYDPLGFLYSSTGYAAADGTSFAAPLVAGAAALVKQSHPGYSAQDIKSALVNSANAGAVLTSDAGDKATVQWTGAGLLDAGAAVNATVVADPPVLSFGAIVPGGAALPLTRRVTFTNKGSSAVTLTISVTPQVAASATSVSVDRQTITLQAAGASAGADSATVTFTVSGTAPADGSYTGFVTVAGSNVSLKLPYMFLAGSNTLGAAGTIIPFYAYQGVVEWMAGMDFGPFPVQVLDSAGLPVAGKPVTFSAPTGALTMSSVAIPMGNNAVRTVPPCTPASSQTSVTCNTDDYGVAWVNLKMGPNTSMPKLGVAAEGKRSDVWVNVRQQPTITSVSDVTQNATTIAPGSYVSIFGSGLSDFTAAETTRSLPLALAGLNFFVLPQYVNVSFDVPSAGISVPGRMVMASPLQVNVQAPWELQGLPAGTSVQMKVTINDYIGLYEYGNVFSVPVADVSPAFFEIPGATAGSKTVAAVIANTANVVTAGSPAPKNGYVELYANGLGPVNNPPASGEPATTNLSWTKNTPTVKIAGQTAPVLYNGLAPGFPGLYQVNVQIPANAPAGLQDIELTIAGKTARSKIPVQ